MRSYFLLAVLVSGCYKFIFAGNGYPAKGSRSIALGGASATLHDLFSALDNQAGLSTIKTITAGIFYENRFLLPQLSLKSLACALPVKGGTLGLCITSFGYRVYNENKYGIAFGKALGDKLSMGVQLNYFYTHIDADYNNCKTIAAALGIQVQLTTNLQLGVHVFNPTHHKLNRHTDERMPTVFKIGFQYNFNKYVRSVVETEKDIAFKPVFKAGIEYHALHAFYLRIGVASNPALFSFGFGMQLQQLKLDIASAYHQIMGFSPNISCSYKFKPNGEE